MRVFSIIFGLLVLTGFGAGVTELSLASGRQTADSPGVAASPSPSTTPSATPTPTPLATPTPTPALSTAVTNGFVHLRAGSTTASTDLADLQAGTRVQLTGPVQGLWQPVSYQGESGFIYVTYLNY